MGFGPTAGTIGCKNRAGAVSTIYMARNPYTGKGINVSALGRDERRPEVEMNESLRARAFRGR